jgi:bifunctional non-homologous end joining protein LigD
MPAATLRPSTIPASLEPQLCTAASKVPSGGDWLHEIKYDGWRLMARKQGDVVRISRGGVEWSDRLPRVRIHGIRCLSSSLVMYRRADAEPRV